MHRITPINKRGRGSSEKGCFGSTEKGKGRGGREETEGRRNMSCSEERVPHPPFFFV